VGAKNAGDRSVPGALRGTEWSKKRIFLIIRRGARESGLLEIEEKKYRFNG